MLVSMKSILDDASKNYYGVMSMNSINIEMVRGGIEAATEEHSPIIIQMGPGQIAKHAHMPEIVPVVKVVRREGPHPRGPQPRPRLQARRRDRRHPGRLHQRHDRRLVAAL